MLFSPGVGLFSIYVNLIYLDDKIVCEYCVADNNDHAEYDYVIVGAGSAGSTIAGGLANNTGYKILILEAGGDGGLFFDVPVFGPLLQGTKYDWQYGTISQQNACLAMDNKVCKWPMGKIVGGSARLNNMIHVKGHPNDYQDWFDKKSNDYDYASQVLQYFEKIEQYLPVNNLTYKSLLSSSVIQAGKEAGFLQNEYFNLGFFEPQLNQEDGSRFTTSHSSLFRNNKNITLKTHSLVTRIIIKRNIAVGVKYTSQSRATIAKARKGIILAAGAIGTPKLLMLSGIGPRDHLEELGIPVLNDLPVGLNLQDHVTTGLDLVLVDSDLGFNSFDMFMPKSVIDYFSGSGGPWSFPGVEAVAFINTDSELPLSAPDLQLMIMPLGITEDCGIHLKNTVGIRSDIWKEYFSEINNKKSISILPIVLHPKSTGYVKLFDRNPTSPPIIDPNYLSHPDDINVLVKGIEVIKKLLNTTSMRKLGANLYKKKFPGCENEIFDTKEYWMCYVKYFTLTSFHPCGTCKLGLYNDSTAVVDKSSFEVKGFSRLYVSDASIFPNLPSGNINAAVIMVAEKLIEYLLATNKAYFEETENCLPIDVFYKDWSCKIKKLFF